ncbi:unnamed protein product [Microthlaspi erraticum]|uniref:Reverse transcriptase zinc-binding domain-containing protein n=1 Tax=Microthlaspi erraticum TaxID=1685480 RepID=A0A6D2INC1_9BRAS|nr:unnamed protein product [Microthlaspi erraticum]
MDPPAQNRGPDRYLWRNSAGSFDTNFSSKSTWNFLRTLSPTVPWEKVIKKVGVDVPAECILCSQGIETHSHLFFECEFSSELWTSLTTVAVVRTEACNASKFFR